MAATLRMASLRLHGQRVEVTIGSLLIRSGMMVTIGCNLPRCHFFEITLFNIDLHSRRGDVHPYGLARRP